MFNCIQVKQVSNNLCLKTKLTLHAHVTSEKYKSQLERMDENLQNVNNLLHVRNNTHKLRNKISHTL